MGSTADNQDAQRPTVPTPALRWRRAFPGEDTQISTLRHWLECLLPPCLSRDDLMSVAVELGTNALRHTSSGSGGQFVVEVTWSAGMARIAVYDGGSPDSPRVTEDLLCEDGRGLLMVSALSVRMGVGGNAQGRVVWADVPWAGPDVPSQPDFPEGLRPRFARPRLTWHAGIPAYSSGSAPRPGHGGHCHHGATRANW